MTTAAPPAPAPCTTALDILHGLVLRSEDGRPWLDHDASDAVLLVHEAAAYGSPKRIELLDRTEQHATNLAASGADPATLPRFVIHLSNTLYWR